MQTLAAYEGARVGRRTEGWQTLSTSADAAGQGEWRLHRDRARDLVRNNPHAARALQVQVSHTIGIGIMAEVGPALRTRWEDWYSNCDADGSLDLGGILAQVERARFESGEVLIRFVRTGEMSRSPIPTQLRVLEPEYLDESRDSLVSDRGGEVRHGIERDDNGRVLGYWLFDEHPGEAASVARIRRTGFASNFVPAEDVIHVFRRLRPGQTRGVSEFSPVMLRMRDLDDYDDAEVMRKKIEACLVGVLTSAEGAAASAIGPQTKDSETDLTKERMRPAQWYRARPGESISFNTPQASGGYADFKNLNLQDVSVGLGIPAPLLTGNLADVNYTSLRGMLIDYRKQVQQLQWLLYIPQVCRRIEARFRADVSRIRSGQGDRTAFDWTPSKFELMDPLKEAQAELEMILSGTEPWDEVARSHGWDGDELLDRIAAHQKKLDAKGVVLKSDPRNQIQSRRASGTPSDAEPGTEEDAA